ncbi:hypothetical protein MJD09_19575 [bacterium]|nr:hypothetical protein [bacterium]
MAKKVKRGSRSFRGASSTLPYAKRNFQLFGIAVLTLIVGYWALAQPPVDGFLTLTLAPILLVIGYCVLIPLAIIYADRSKSQEKK